MPLDGFQNKYKPGPGYSGPQPLIKMTEKQLDELNQIQKRIKSFESVIATLIKLKEGNESIRIVSRNYSDHIIKCVNSGALIDQEIMYYNKLLSVDKLRLEKTQIIHQL